jgi:uncharacterized protein (TIGR03067 family)
MLNEPREAQPRKSAFKLVAGQVPGMDLTTTFEGESIPLRTLAIYELAGDTLTYCIAAPGLPRPSEFATATGDGRTLVVLSRMPVTTP